MATNFPASLDSLTNPTSTQTLNSPSHSSQHANINDAVEAIQTKVGVDNSAVTSSLDYKVRVGNPIGAITMWSTNTAPTGWLICDGTAVSRSTYSGLFAVIGTTFGSGDGSTTFNLPNLKGRVPVGRDAADADWDVLGETRGGKTNALGVNNLPAHTHTATTTTTTTVNSNSTEFVYRLSSASGGEYATGINANNSLLSGNNFGLSNTTFGMAVSYAAGGHAHTASSTSSTTVSSSGGNGTATGDAFNVIQPSIVLNFIIRH